MIKIGATNVDILPKKTRHETARRLLNLLLLVGICFISIAVWFDNDQKEAEFIERQSRLIGESYIAQASRVHFAHIAGQKSETSQQNLQQILSEDYIYAISLISGAGERLFFASHNNTPALEVTQHASDDYLIYIEPLLMDEKIRGFSKVVLVKQMVQALQREHYRQQSSKTLLLFILAILVGCLVTSMYHSLKPRSKKGTKAETIA